MKAVVREQPLGAGLDMSSPVALAYETTEEARLLLGGADSEFIQARAAAGEAAYYLSDTITPDDRASLLGLAERRRKPRAPSGEEDESRATEALTLLADAADTVEDMLRGPSASSELRIALRALRGAIGKLACHFGLAGNQLDVGNLQSQRPSVLRRRRARP